MLGPAHDVLQKDNGVIDQEPDGERERHQSQVVDRIIQRPHDQEGHQERKRQRHHRDEGVTRPAEENKDHQHHEDERDYQRVLHVGY